MIVRLAYSSKLEMDTPRSPVPARIHIGTEYMEEESGVRLLTAQVLHDWITMAKLDATVTVSTNKFCVCDY